jgi:hypothetical protein
MEHDIGHLDWENVRSELLEKVAGSDSDFNTMRQQRSPSLTAEPTTEDAIGELSDGRYCASDYRGYFDFLQTLLQLSTPWTPPLSSLLKTCLILIVLNHHTLKSTKSCP